MGVASPEDDENDAERPPPTSEVDTDEEQEAEQDKQEAATVKELWGEDRLGCPVKAKPKAMTPLWHHGTIDPRAPPIIKNIWEIFKSKS